MYKQTESKSHVFSSTKNRIGLLPIFNLIDRHDLFNSIAIFLEIICKFTAMTSSMIIPRIVMHYDGLSMMGLIDTWCGSGSIDFATRGPSPK